MKIILALTFLVSLTDCRKDTTQQQSHGFAPPRPPDPPSAAEIAKLKQQRHPAHFADRPLPPPGSFTLYVDEKLTRTVTSNELQTPMAVTDLVGKNVRAILVHSEMGEVWMAANQLAPIVLTLNHRGEVKLTTRTGGDRGGGNGGGGGGAGRGGGGGGEGEVGNLRGVHWIEARTSTSTRLADEP